MPGYQVPILDTDMPEYWVPICHNMRFAQALQPCVERMRSKACACLFHMLASHACATVSVCASGLYTAIKQQEQKTKQWAGRKQKRKNKHKGRKRVTHSSRVLTQSLFESSSHRPSEAMTTSLSFLLRLTSTTSGVVETYGGLLSCCDSHDVAVRERVRCGGVGMTRSLSAGHEQDVANRK